MNDIDQVPKTRQICPNCRGRAAVEAPWPLVIWDQDAAVERIGQRLRKRVGTISDEAMGMLATDVLRAAAGEGT